MVLLISILAVIAVAAAGSAAVILYRKHKLALRVLAEVYKAKNDVAREYTLLTEKYLRVQHGYDQGVLEGMRQGYVNVRATLADELYITGGTDGAKLRAFILPLLAHLGEHETRVLDEMKGITSERRAFEDAVQSAPAINMFPGNNKPQVAKEVTQLPPGEPAKPTGPALSGGTQISEGGK